MGRAKVHYVCEECGWDTTKWVGQCPECGAWGTITEMAAPPPVHAAALPPVTPAEPISQISPDDATARSCGLSEVDRVLGGGIVPGAVILLAGEPGVGKSTLLLDLAATAARRAEREGRAPVLYLTGEESAAQVRIRADRIGAISDHLHLAALTDLDAALAQIAAVAPSLVIVDSVQTLYTASASGSPGSITQVRAVTNALIEAAKSRHLPTIVVGHVTKDGNIAGPRTLEHLVDVVCMFEGERHASLRLLRAVKNRYGATDEVGCFALGDRGTTQLPDPSGLFLEGADAAVPGTCLTITVEGRRPMPLQMQALLTPTNLTNPRRTAVGISPSRTSMLLAVLQGRVGLPVDRFDVYISTVGGAKTSEPAVDLAVVLAVASAHADRIIPATTIACGEVGLNGQLRSVTAMSRRLSEAARLGFTTAIIPAHSDVRAPDSMRIVPVGSVRDAITAALTRQEMDDPAEQPPAR
ncbi:MAG: DNA repair protein RadA [Bowdeniella nasicola]|nr:DNA repair protein RadA [Bowdeniella nasicola]